ncbi:MAG: lipid-A-disaccharide synthase [Candidatus Hydrogenedentes bacterium]|nr:lipid-A-disaccharide synthase [Candidatus Hydrogenedentota bacterium]
MTRLFFSAGEASGDQHGAHLIEALRALDPAIECEGLGGTRMEAAGMTLRHDLAGRAIMGFVEIVRSFGFIRSVFMDTVGHLKRSRPDGLVVIDYPGFNIRLAQRAKAMGIPVVYYISPQVWAWKKGRIHTIAKAVKKMLVILPFEKALYDKIGLDCAYVGHPLLDHLDSIDVKDTYTDGLVVGIMPGSREQEIGRILGVMLEVARGIRERYPETLFVAPCVDEARAAQIRAMAGDFPLEVAPGGMYEVLKGAHFCLVASGTATVETAVFEVPMAVIYKVRTPSYWLARLLVDVDAIAMVNILAKKPIVREFIQGEATVENILPVALELMDESPARETMIQELKSIREMLSSGASENAAREILSVIKGRNDA